MAVDIFARSQASDLLLFQLNHPAIAGGQFDLHVSDAGQQVIVHAKLTIERAFVSIHTRW
ncbi:hypothetical protein [Rivihabitans pingtungensis]|uniref:hypothetical protein n=1 Tax=Rivihabitans pingtungensis TaxID=1054498 RepID=UPI002D1F9E35|nr:hypothetical protein [Rivihabitans pingtungensis]